MRYQSDPYSHSTNEHLKLPTFIEVDAQEGANCQYSVNRVFSAVAQPVPVVRVEAPGPRVT